MQITWFGWLYAILLVLGAFTKVAQIGERRDPVTNGEAIMHLFASALILWGLFAVGVVK